MNKKVRDLKESGIDIREMSDREKEKLYRFVNKKNYYRARDIRSKLLQSIEDVPSPEENFSEEAINLSCAAGFKDNIFTSVYSYEFTLNGDAEYKLDNKCSVGFQNIMLGMPKVISFKNRYGYRTTMNLLTWPIAIEYKDLEKYIPGKYSKTEKIIYDVYDDKAYKVIYLEIFDIKKEVDRVVVDASEELLAETIVKMIYGEISSLAIYSREMSNVIHYNSTVRYDYNRDEITAKMLDSIKTFNVRSLKDIDEFIACYFKL